jgi:hypothetical protein
MAQAVFSAACEGDSPIFAAGTVDPLGIFPFVPRKLGQSPVNGYGRFARFVPLASVPWDPLPYTHSILAGAATTLSGSPAKLSSPATFPPNRNPIVAWARRENARDARGGVERRVGVVTIAARAGWADP